MDWLFWNHSIRIVQGASITDNVIGWLNDTIGEEFRDWSLHNAYLEHCPSITFRTGYQAEMFRRRWPFLCV